MDITLLKTKLYKPPLRSELVSRPHLVERFNAGLKHKLTLITAPAGYGKTTLLSECVHSGQMPFGWLTLDDGDNDPARFWSYVIFAMQTAIPDMGKSAVELLRSSQSPPIKPVITNIINEINEVGENFALVLDDYHMIQTGTIHKALAFLLDNLPPKIHLTIATRADPSLPLARLRGRGQLSEFRADDLRFTLEETETLLNKVMGLGLSYEDIKVLDARTEGWIASLQMAAVSMQRQSDISSFIVTFSGSHRYIMDFLSEEVLSQQEPAKQSFLLETSILDRLIAPLCNAVTRREDSQAILEQLDSANLFVVPLDDERQWYRYHHLFADLLRSLVLQLKNSHVAELHGIASEWF